MTFRQNKNVNMNCSFSQIALYLKVGFVFFTFQFQNVCLFKKTVCNMEMMCGNFSELDSDFEPVLCIDEKPGTKGPNFKRTLI
jgi:hypothetical protein